MLTRAGQGVTGVAHFDGGSFWVAIRVDISDPSDAFIELTHQTRDWIRGTASCATGFSWFRPVPTYGGRRGWFQCPRTGRRATKLFLPNGGRHFWSRRAYRLGYACQREDRFSRLQRAEDRARRIWLLDVVLMPIAISGSLVISLGRRLARGGHHGECRR